MTGTFDAAGEVSSTLVLRPGESLTASLASTTVLGLVALMEKTGATWRQLAWMRAGEAVTWVNETDKNQTYRLQQVQFTSRASITFDAVPDGGDLNLDYDSNPLSITNAQGATELQAALRAITGLEKTVVTGDFTAGFVITYYGVTPAAVDIADDTSDLVDGVTPVTVTIAIVGSNYTLTADTGEVVRVLFRNSKGEVVLALLDDDTISAPFGMVSAAQVVATEGGDAGLVTTFESVSTTDGAPEALDINVYESRITTSGSTGSESVAIGDGTGAVVGQRHLVTYLSEGHTGDVLVLDHGNIVNAAGSALTAASLAAEGDFILLEWNGAKWQEVYSSGATLTT